MGDSNGILVLAVGRLLFQKGYHDMLLAFAQVQKRFPDTFLVIVGVGDLLETLVEFSQSLGLSGNVKFLGARGDVPRLLAAADVFVNSSHWEGLSIAMLEAMAAGLPIVATSVGDAAILLSTGCGYLVSAKDSKAFAQALENLISDSETMRKMGDIAREYVKKNYTADLWLDKLLLCYSRAQRKDASVESKL